MSGARGRTAVPLRRGGQTESLARDPEKLALLLSAIRELSGELELDVLLGRAMKACTRLVEADRSSLFIYDRASDELWSKVAQGLDTLVLRFPASKGLAGRAARTGEIVNVADAYSDEQFNREFDEKTGYRTRSVLCVPMKDARGRVLGVIEVLNKAGGEPFVRDDEWTLATLGPHISVFIENAQLHESIETLFESFVRAASTAIEERDPATSGHSKRVATYALGLARAAHEAEITRFTRSRLRQLRYAALLHDFGKIGVRECVLTKHNKLSDDRLDLIRERLRRVEVERASPGALAGELELVHRTNPPGLVCDEDLVELRKLSRSGLLTAEEVECLSVRRGNLTAAEWVDMRSHADRSLHILSEMPWPEEYGRVPDIAHRHHEKLDGSGYPSGLSGDDIDIDSRILGIADIYDALTAQDRPYKRAVPLDKARGIIEEDAAAGRLDPELVRIFFERNIHLMERAGDTRLVQVAS